ncbi:MAG: hypothetical protein IM459_04155 [Microcystis sp. M085S1]|nr:hypothetical protein [Microcystis sp. M085S1]
MNYNYNEKFFPEEQDAREEEEQDAQEEEEQDAQEALELFVTELQSELMRKFFRFHGKNEGKCLSDKKDIQKEIIYKAKLFMSKARPCSASADPLLHLCLIYPLNREIIKILLLHFNDWSMREKFNLILGFLRSLNLCFGKGDKMIYGTETAIFEPKSSIIFLNFVTQFLHLFLKKEEKKTFIKKIQQEGNYTSFYLYLRAIYNSSKG